MRLVFHLNSSYWRTIAKKNKRYKMFWDLFAAWSFCRNKIWNKSSISWGRSRVSICKAFAQFLRKKAKFFVSLRYIFTRKNNTLRIHSQTLFRTKLRYSALALFCFAQFSHQFQIFSLVIYEIALFGIKLQCSQKGTDYLPKTLLCNVMHDGTLQIQMFTISHKHLAVFCQLLLLNLS